MWFLTKKQKDCLPTYSDRVLELASVAVESVEEEEILQQLLVTLCLARFLLLFYYYHKVTHSLEIFLMQSI